MRNLIIHIYQHALTGFAGCIEPGDSSWILFIRNDGTPMFYPRRTETGAVIDESIESD